MALVDARRRFININIGYNGRVSDGGVFSQSSLCQDPKDERNPLNIPPPKPLPGRTLPIPYFIAAYDSFPLKVNIMKSYPQRTNYYAENI